MSVSTELAPVLGPHAGPTIALLGLSATGEASALYRLPESFFMWAVSAAGFPADEAPAVRRWFREFLIRSRLQPPFLPSQVPNPLGASVAWSALHPRPAPHHTWVELMADGLPVSAAVVAYSLSLIFDESATIAKYNRAVGFSPAHVVFPFRDRAAASGASFLVPSLDLDQGTAQAGAMSWSEGPRKRLCLARDSLASGPAATADPRLVRRPEALGAEAGLRNMAASIMGSWKSYASGLRC